jgi:hypothetical protein
MEARQSIAPNRRTWTPRLDRRSMSDSHNSATALGVIPRALAGNCMATVYRYPGRVTCDRLGSKAD